MFFLLFSSGKSSIIHMKRSYIPGIGGSDVNDSIFTNSNALRAEFRLEAFDYPKENSFTHLIEVLHDVLDDVAARLQIRSNRNDTTRFHHDDEVPEENYIN
jgi:hypothetical protein